MSISYEYNEDSAVQADKNANAITDSGPYIGTFKKAWAITAQSGTHGIAFEFESPGDGTAEFSLYTVKEDGTQVFGMAMVNAILYLVGTKSLKSAPGLVWKYDEDAKARIEVEGEVFPDLCGKPIGIVLQKELYSKQGGKGDGTRMGLYGLFQPETKLMMSELKERKTKPVKLERLLKGLKTKDTRKQSNEPAQASVSGLEGADGLY